MSFGCEVIQERFDFAGTHFQWILFALEQHVLPNPIAIGIFGIATEVSAAADDRNLVKQTEALTPYMSLLRLDKYRNDSYMPARAENCSSYHFVILTASTLTH